MPAAGKPVIRLHPADNVVVTRADLPAGASLPDEKTVARDRIPSGHKIATAAIARGEAVRRYGQIIGFASTDIAPGAHVHTHNCEIRDFQRDYAHGTLAVATQYANEPATFQGYVRPDGRAATRNYVGVLTSVNCSATVARYIGDAFRTNPLTGEGPLAEFPNVDGVVALTHKTGCGMAAEGEGMDLLRRVIAGYARHPNFAAVLVLGLGCETNQIGGILRAHNLNEGALLQTMTIQDTGGAAKTVREGVARIKELLPDLNRTRRESVPASEITIGLQCGGSDGYSGISANPALGAASDLLVRHGGTVILSESPETYGAEHLLTRRAVSREVGEKLVAVMKWWEGYTAKHGGTMDNNPSPGNKAGGITTILEKSLGAAAKAGSTNLVDVVGYAEPVKAKGFVFMDTPGYDPVSATGQVAGGANLICFTTGRGSVYGCKPAPSLKLATNTRLYQRMTDDMDINCGTIVDGTETVQACGERIFDLILRTASGQKTKSEEMGFGDDEFAPWVLGATM
ncbi:MAG TPA: altronate dehydratase family protein [Alphaproteobacteria bacterium]|nr:altronate dehydratase family protein [Alphaproteobacteria bacterium]